MHKLKRKPFFIKGNFQIFFIAGFILFLLLEVAGAGFFIYKLSAEKIENAQFSSHININQSIQIIKPVVIKINIYTILFSIIIAGILVLITYFQLHTLFSEIMGGLEKLGGNYTLFRLKPRGTKKTRELIREFNQVGIYFDQRLNDLQLTLNSLSAEKDLKQIAKLHHKLHLIISHKS